LLNQCLNNILTMPVKIDLFAFYKSCPVTRNDDIQLQSST